MWNDKIYDVIHLDFSNLASRSPVDFKKGLCRRIIDQFSIYKDINFTYNVNDEHPADIFDKICCRLDDNSVILLIDEYDAPLTHHLNEPIELKDITNILNDFYATVKQYTGKFHFIFITGITRASHVSIFSAFNNLLDISLDDQFNDLLGFTQDDLERYFAKYIEKAGNILNIKSDDVYKKIKQYYNG